MLIFLEKRLSRNAREINEIKTGIEAAAQQLKHFHISHVNVISKLADIYRQSISPLGPKIIVKGEQSHLSNPGQRRAYTYVAAGRHPSSTSLAPGRR